MKTKTLNISELKNILKSVYDDIGQRHKKTYIEYLGSENFAKLTEAWECRRELDESLLVFANRVRLGKVTGTYKFRVAINVQSSIERFRDKNNELGRKRKEFYLTHQEHIAMKKYLAVLRGQ